VNEAATRDRDAELDQFLKRLSTAWQEGEVRPTHRQAPRPKRHWRTRKDPFATIWPTICGWLDAEPERTAQDLLRRLQSHNIGTFPDSQLRTLQRRVKAWRSEMARHALIREVLYDEIDTNSRLRLHRKIVEVMEEIHHKDLGPRLAELAYHFREAGIEDKAIDYLIRGGQAAEAVFAYEEAAHLYTTAIDAIRLHEPTDRAKELEVLLAVANVQFYAGSFPTSKEAFARAAEVARGLQAWKSFARAVLGLAGEPQEAMVRQPDLEILALIEEGLAGSASTGQRDGNRSAAVGVRSGHGERARQSTSAGWTLLSGPESWPNSKWERAFSSDSASVSRVGSKPSKRDSLQLDWPPPLGHHTDDDKPHSVLITFTFRSFPAH
jgi:hypothetical protein